MKQVTGWWFGTVDRRLLNNDGRPIVIGDTHNVEGDIIPCQHGLHLSTKIIDALTYAPGPVIYKVRGSGVIVPHGNPTDKYACSQRTYLAGGINISSTLRLFARKCALDVVHLWNAPTVVVEYLKTGDESIRYAAWAAALDAAWAAARAAALATAWYAARAAAWAAAWAAARDAALATARDAARDAAWAAARDAARDRQNKRLTTMVTKLLKQ
jgi:hypothetical protein